jgi:hypothetical protein
MPGGTIEWGFVAAPGSRTTPSKDAHWGRATTGVSLCTAGTALIFWAA